MSLGIPSLHLLMYDTYSRSLGVGFNPQAPSSICVFFHSQLLTTKVPPPMGQVGGYIDSSTGNYDMQTGSC